MDTVAKGLLAHGVTSFCPTVVTSTTETYHQVLPRIKKREGGEHGATILGVHVEGPFISPTKKGAHEESCIRKLDEVPSGDYQKFTYAYTRHIDCKPVFLCSGYRFCYKHVWKPGQHLLCHTGSRNSKFVFCY